MVNPLISQYLKSRISLENLSSAELAQRIGVSPSAISLWIHMQRFPDGEQLIKIIKAFPGIVQMF